MELASSGSNATGSKAYGMPEPRKPIAQYRSRSWASGAQEFALETRLNRRPASTTAVGMGRVDNDPLSRTFHCVEPMNAALVSELNAWRNNPELLSGIAYAAGARSQEELADPLYRPVTGYWIDPGQQVFAVWVLTPGSFVMHERSLDSQTFTLAVPIARVRRVVEQFDGQRISVTIEIDADRVVVDLGGSGDDEGNISLAGSALHAGYTLTADAADVVRAGRLAEFARVVRNAIA